jgi:hypothetical protein
MAAPGLNLKTTTIATSASESWITETGQDKRGAALLLQAYAVSGRVSEPYFRKLARVPGAERWGFAWRRYCGVPDPLQQ